MQKRMPNDVRYQIIYNPFVRRSRFPTRKHQLLYIFVITHHLGVLLSQHFLAGGSAAILLGVISKKPGIFAWMGINYGRFRKKHLSHKMLGCRLNNSARSDSMIERICFTPSSWRGSENRILLILLRNYSKKLGAVFHDTETHNSGITKCMIGNAWSQQ